MSNLHAVKNTYSATSFCAARATISIISS